MKRKTLMGFMVVAALLIFAGCGLTGAQSEKDPDTNPPQTGENQNQAVNPQPTAEKVELTLYFGDDQAMYLIPEKRTVDKNGKTIAELSVEELIRGPVNKELHKTIPDGTKLISLEVVDGVAFTNFSKEIKTNHPGGSTGERMTSQAIVQTLTRLPGIKSVQFLIEGQKEESIWGHGYTAEPVGPEKDLVKE